MLSPIPERRLARGQRVQQPRPPRQHRGDGTVLAGTLHGVQKPAEYPGIGFVRLVHGEQYRVTIRLQPVRQPEHRVLATALAQPDLEQPRNSRLQVDRDMIKHSGRPPEGADDAPAQQLGRLQILRDQPDERDRSSFALLLRPPAEPPEQDRLANAARPVEVGQPDVGLAAAKIRQNIEQRLLDFRAVPHVRRRPSGPGPEGVARKRICHGAFTIRAFAMRSRPCAHRSFTQGSPSALGRFPWIERSMPTATRPPTPVSDPPMPTRLESRRDHTAVQSLMAPERAAGGGTCATVPWGWSPSTYKRSACGSPSERRPGRQRLPDGFTTLVVGLSPHRNIVGSGTMPSYLPFAPEHVAWCGHHRSVVSVRFDTRREAVCEAVGRRLRR